MEAGVGAQLVKSRFRLEPNESGTTLLVGVLQPLERLVSLIQAGMKYCYVERGHISCFRELVELSEEALRLVCPIPRPVAVS